MASETTEKGFPAQHQPRQPGREGEMAPKPREDAPWYHGSDKLAGRTALITGGDSGIGRSVAVLFAREGADVTVVYYDEHDDARYTKQLVEEEGRRCLLLAGDVQDSAFCRETVERTVGGHGRLDILVNNAAFQSYQDDLETLTDEQLEKTFRTNIFSYFYMARAALRYFPEGSAIINTTSVTAYKGSGHLLDYSTTKAAIVGFTRSLAQALVKRSIRVNAVAPGPIWTPIIPASFPADYVAGFGQDAPMGRAGQPEEVAPCYVFLAARDSSYITGQVLHPNGGYIVNG